MSDKPLAGKRLYLIGKIVRATDFPTEQFLADVAAAKARP